MKQMLSKAKAVFLPLLLGLLLIFLLSSSIQSARGVDIPLTFGWGSATVASGSMEPEIPVGALVVIHRQEDYNVGDVVAYNRTSGLAVTHRILEIQGDFITTQGDANPEADEPFSRQQIIGRIVLVIPGLGALLLILKNPAVAAGIALLALLAYLIPVQRKK